MRLVFVDEHERAFESLDRIELMTFESAEARRTVINWMAGRVAERLTEEERQALREAAEPELGLWRLTGIWPATRYHKPDPEPRGALGSPLVAEVGAEVHALVCPPGEGRVVAACADGSLAVVDLIGNEEPRRYETEASALHAIGSGPQPGQVVVAGARGYLALWDLAGGQELARTGHPGCAYYHTVQRLAGCAAVLVEGSGISDRYDWEEPGAPGPKAEEATPGEEETDGFVDGAKRFRRAVTHRLRWDLARDELTAVAEIDDHVYGSVLTPDGGLWLGFRARRAGLQRLEPAGPTLRLGAHLAPVSAAALSADGRLAVTGDQAGVIWLWHPRTGQARERLTLAAEGLDGVTSLALAPNDGLLAVGSRRGLVYLYRPGSQEPFWVLPGQAKAVTALAFTRDGERLVSAGRDGAIRAWEVGPLKLGH